MGNAVQIMRVARGKIADQAPISEDNDSTRWRLMKGQEATSNIKPTSAAGNYC
jgi:hypothetical protein